MTKILHVDDLFIIFAMVCAPAASDPTPLPLFCRFINAQADDGSCLLRSCR